MGESIGAALGAPLGVISRHLVRSCTRRRSVGLSDRRTTGSMGSRRRRNPGLDAPGDLGRLRISLRLWLTESGARQELAPLQLQQALESRKSNRRERPFSVCSIPEFGACGDATPRDASPKVLTRATGPMLSQPTVTFDDCE